MNSNMEVESTLVRPHRRPGSPDYVLRALYWGVPSLVVLIIVWIVNLAFGDTIRASILAGLWSAVSFFLVVVCICILVPCTAIISWRCYRVWDAHQQARKKEAYELQLLQEQVRGTRLANNAIQQAERQGDNYTITAGSVSVQIVRSATQLEQARIQYASRVQAQLERGEQKLLAGPTPNRKKEEVEEEDEPKSDPVLDALLAEFCQDRKIHTFAELLEAGIVQEVVSRGFILLGYVNRALRYGAWTDLYSCAVGGVPGSGKTTTVRFLLFQAILIGSKVLMVDPHIGDEEESLAAQFTAFKNIHLMKPCGDNPEAVTKRIRWFMAEYKRRKLKGIKKPNYIFVIDEFNEVVALLPDEVKKELSELLVRIAQGGRKFGLYCLLIGQRWSDQDLGGRGMGATLRSSLAARLVHRFGEEPQAAKLAGSQKAAACLNLKKGHYYFRDTDGVMSYTITPLTVFEDGAVIQLLLEEAENTIESSLVLLENGGQSPLSRRTGPIRDARFIPQNTVVHAENGGNGAENARLHALALQVLRMQAKNANKPDIMKAVWGVNPGGTKDYQLALEEYKLVMSYIAEQFVAQFEAQEGVE